MTLSANCITNINTLVTTFLLVYKDYLFSDLAKGFLICNICIRFLAVHNCVLFI